LLQHLGLCERDENGTCLRYDWAQNCLGSNGARLCIQGLRVAQVGTGRLGQYAATINNIYSTNGFDLSFDTWGCCGGHCDVGGPLYVFSGYSCPLGDDAQCMGTPGYCSKTCSQDVCRDWWKKDRVYTCQNSGFDFSGSQDRVRTIKQSVQDNTSSIYYTDYRKTGDGTWKYEGTTTDVSGVARPAATSCQMRARPKARKPNTATTKTDTRPTSSRIPIPTNTSIIVFTLVLPRRTGRRDRQGLPVHRDFAEAASSFNPSYMRKDFVFSSGKRSLCNRARTAQALAAEEGVSDGICKNNS